MTREDNHRNGEDALRAAEKELGRAKAAQDKLRAREEQARERYRVAKQRARGKDLKRLADAATAARGRLDTAVRQRNEGAARLREARNLLREQEQVSRAAARKEKAREKAVAAFLERWERQYDADLNRKMKNVRLRKQSVREA